MSLVPQRQLSPAPRKFLACAGQHVNLSHLRGFV